MYEAYATETCFDSLDSNAKENPSGCYKQFSWVEKWLNSTSVKKAVGVDPSISFQLINNDVTTAFHRRGDAVRNSAALLPDLINDGVRLLVYAGMAGEHLRRESYASKF